MQEKNRCRKTVVGVITLLAPDFPLADTKTAVLREEIDRCMKDAQVKLVLDLKYVPYIDSAGLETLIDADAQLRQKGGVIKIANPNDVCHDILIATRLIEKLEVFSDTERAGRSFV